MVDITLNTVRFGDVSAAIGFDYGNVQRLSETKVSVDIYVQINRTAAGGDVPFFVTIYGGVSQKYITDFENDYSGPGDPYPTQCYYHNADGSHTFRLKRGGSWNQTIDPKNHYLKIPVTFDADPGSFLQYFEVEFSNYTMVNGVRSNPNILQTTIDFPAYEYTITFNGNGATSGVPTPIKKPHGGAGSLPTDIIPSRTGYNFLGWSADPDSTQPEYEYYEEYPELFLIYVDTNLDLYAIWEPIKCILTFDYNLFYPLDPSYHENDYGSTFTFSEIEIPIQDDEMLATYRVTFEDPRGVVEDPFMMAVICKSYEFSHWEASNGEKYMITDSYTITADETFTAIWNETINGETIDLPNLTSNSYEFLGWSENENASSGIKGTYKPTSDVTLYAIWKRVKYTLTFDYNYHSLSPFIEYKDDGNPFKFDYQPSRDNSQGECYILELSDSMNVLSTEPYISVQPQTIYSFAHWEASDGTTYKIGDYYTNNADETFTAIWNETVVEDTAELPDLKADGYKFLGWSENENATSGIIGSYKPTSDVTLYAIWEALTTSATIYNKVNGTWKSGAPYVKINGQWKTAVGVYVKVNGVWKTTNHNSINTNPNYVLSIDNYILTDSDGVYLTYKE